MSEAPAFRADITLDEIVSRLRKRLGLRKTRRVITLHHLACSGGTIMTKCLAAMPGTMVLSEIHPERLAQPAFHPLEQIRRGYNAQLAQAHRQAIRKHFLREIALAYKIARSLGKVLVVRDHAHVDFAWRQSARSSLADLLQTEFDVIPIITVRDPREVWMSLRREGWFDGTPEELCRAHLALLDAFPNAPVFRYEDFTARPVETMQAICGSANIEFDTNFQDRLGEVKHLTGDSGRKGMTIAPRPPKTLADADLRAFAEAPSFALFAARMGYETSDLSDGRQA